jgi:hypothetical protein
LRLSVLRREGQTGKQGQQSNHEFTHGFDLSKPVTIRETS